MKTLSAQQAEIPVLGLGTWQMKGKTCQRTVREALEMGYRHIDTAQMYRNEDRVGSAVKNSSVPRDEIFITTKLLPKNLAYEDVLSTYEESRNRLQTDYVDLLLIHSPSRSVPIEESINAMNRLQEESKVRHIGVSNFSVRQTREAMDASATPIVTNQVRYHPYYGQEELLKFCQEEDLILTAYSPLGRGRVASDNTLQEIGKSHGKTAVQVALKWLFQQDRVIVIPKASTTEHLRENMEIFDFSLTDTEMDRIYNL